MNVNSTSMIIVGSTMSSLVDTLLTRVGDEGHHTSNKVTVVGTGQVGMAAAFAMLTQVGLVEMGRRIHHITNTFNPLSAEFFCYRTFVFNV